MKFRDRVVQISSLKGFVDRTFRDFHVEEEARAADDEALLAIPCCILIASVHESVPSHSRFIIAINALNF